LQDKAFLILDFVCLDLFLSDVFICYMRDIIVVYNVFVDILSLLAAVGGLGAFATMISAVYWLGKKFGEIEGKFNAIDQRFREIDKKFDEFENRILRKIERLGNAFIFYQEFFIEFLSREGVMKSDTAEILVREARRVMRLVLANSLTKEEWEKLREYLDKSERWELTLDEADEFLELARKVVKEYGEYSEAWKLHIYATIVRALTIKKYAEKKEERRQELK